MGACGEDTSSSACLSSVLLQQRGAWVIILETAWFRNRAVFSVYSFLFSLRSTYSSGHKFADLEIRILLNTSL